MIFMRKFHVLLISLVLTTLLGCNSNPLQIDVSDVDLELEFYNLDTDMNQAKTKEDFQSINNECKTEFGDFYEYYSAEILRIGKPNDDFVADGLMKFRNDKYMSRIFKESSNLIDDREKLNEEITVMFKHLKHHLPQTKMPSKVMYWNSLFTNSILPSGRVADDHSILAVGLERYLGSSKLYDSLPSPPHYEYIKKKYDKRYLKSDMAKSWILAHVLKEGKREDFLAELIFNGKMMYVTEAMNPEMSPANLLRFSDEDYAWAIDKERIAWEYLIKNNLIYSTDPARIRDFFNMSPFTQGLPEKAPGQIGVFVGWKIVQSYMEANPEVTIEDLVAENNNQKILKGYKINE